MIKVLIVLSGLAAVLGLEYEIMNNLVDYEEPPYQRISLPYPSFHRDNILHNLRTKPIKNAIVMHNKLEAIKHPKYYIESGEVKKSLFKIHTSLAATMNAFAVTLFGGLMSTLKVLTFSIPAIAVGAVLVIGVGKIIAIFLKFKGIYLLKRAIKEFSLFATSQSLDSAMQLLQEGIKTYEGTVGN